MGELTPNRLEFLPCDERIILLGPCCHFPPSFVPAGHVGVDPADHGLVNPLAAIAALIAVVAIVALTSIGTNLTSTFTSIASKLSGS